MAFDLRQTSRDASDGECALGDREVPASAGPPKQVRLTTDPLIRDRYLENLHAMAELVWQDLCREDER